MGIRFTATDYVDSGFTRLPQFGGVIRYVSTTGSDSNTGTDPKTPFRTIAAAIAASSAGDAISLKGGTYTDVGLDMNLNGLELWAEIGAKLIPASGVALTVSGNDCRVAGELEIQGVAGEDVVDVSGNGCYFSRTKILNGACGFCVTGTGTVGTQLAVGFQTTASYDIKGDQTRLYRCNTVGNSASIGYYIRNGADTGVIEDCTSLGHETSSFYIDTGSANWTVFNCSSGGGDGRWVDVDRANVFSNFSYADQIIKELTLDANNTTKQYNMFKVTGQVEISKVYAHVVTPLSSNHTNCHLDLWDGSTSVDLSDAAGLTLSNAPAGSLIVRNQDAGNVLDYQSAATCFLSENASYRDPTVNAIVGQKAGADTYIRFVHTTTDTPSSGEMHWHIHWEPIDDDGFIELV